MPDSCRSGADRLIQDGAYKSFQGNCPQFTCPVRMPILPKLNLSKETSERVADAAMDLFSPATETLGWLGDAIRVHRTRTVLKCFARTKELAAKAGVKLKAPPSKFLNAFIESSSLEEENDKTLIDWWARLMVSAGSAYDAKHVYYTSVLKQISKVELELLEVAVRNSYSEYRLEMVEDGEDYATRYQPSEQIHLPKAFDRSFNSQVRELPFALSYPGVVVLGIFITNEDVSEYWEYSHPDFNEHEMPSWQMLESLQLIRLQDYTMHSEKLSHRVRRAYITALGSSFYFACHDPKLKDAINTRARYKRETRHEEPPRRAKGKAAKKRSKKQK